MSRTYAYCTDELAPVAVYTTKVGFQPLTTYWTNILTHTIATSLVANNFS